MQLPVSKPLAIVGMACRLPGADNLQEYWSLLEHGESAIDQLPASRFNRDLYYDPRRGIPAKSYTSLGGIVARRAFDTAKYRLTPEVAADADASHLALFEVAVEACQQGGFDPFDLPHRRAAVYIGHNRGTSLSGELMYSTLVEHTAQYLHDIPGFVEALGDGASDAVAEMVADVRASYPHRNDHGGPRLGASESARLIMHGFGLQGPYAAINAACASSLVALQLGTRALQLGKADLAVVGGASHVKFDSLVLFSKAQSASASGSRPFDASADGLIAAEGYVVLLLKTLEAALADRNRIMAVISGVGFSSDGRGKSLWAPRKEGQIEAVGRAYAGPGEKAKVQYIEAHATSTRLGDVTELTALSEALGPALPPGRKLPIGSVKGNIGHTLETAGLAGLVKAVLSMQHGVIPPSINVEQLNPDFDWDASPLFVARETQEWPAPAEGAPRRAAVNAFGIGGLNVHVVLDAYPASTGKVVSPGRPSAALEPSQQPAAVRKPSSTESRFEPVAVIGAGVILPGAQSTGQFWKLLVEGRDAFCTVPSQRWDPRLGYEEGACRPGKVPVCRGGFITDYAYDWRKHKVPPKQVAGADPLQFMMLDVVDQALQDAGLKDRPFERRRAGCLVGTEFSGEFAQQLQMGLRLPDFQQTLRRHLRRRGVPEETIEEVSAQFAGKLLERMPALLDETGSFTSSTLASRITKTFDLMGGAAAVDAGGVSGLAVLDACCDALRLGEADLMICAAGQRSLGLPNYEALALSGRLTRGEPRPYDAAADGILPGEGAVALVLKRLDDARRDGDRVRAVLHGVGLCQAESLQQGVSRAWRQALDLARIAPDDVSLIEGAAIGLPQADGDVATALLHHDTSPVSAPRSNAPLLLGSVAGRIGYTFGASALVSVVKAVLELEHELLPCEKQLHEPAPYLAGKPTRGIAPTDSRPLVPANESNRLMAGVVGLGLNNLAGAVVLERGAPVERPSSSKKGRAKAAATPSSVSGADWRIVRLGAGSEGELVGAIEHAAADPSGALAAAANVGEFATADTWRAAFVVDGPERLAAGCKLLQAQWKRDKSAGEHGHRGAFAEQGAFYARLPALRPRVAFLFPGQGSQYAQMLRGLVARDPSAREALDTIDGLMASLSLPRLADVAWEEDHQLGTDVWHTQHAVLLADAVVCHTLSRLGVHPDAVGGHSFGELVALWAAGCWSLAEAALATRARCRAVTEHQNGSGALISASASSEEVIRRLKSASGLHLASFNSPRQTVVGGKAEAVEAFARRLQADGIQARVLQVPGAFHTPLMGGVEEPFLRFLHSMEIDPPAVPVLSSVSGEYQRDAAVIRTNLARQLAYPVRYVAMVERFLAEGFQYLIEVGPGSVLTQLNRQIVGDRPGIICMASNHKRRDAMREVLGVRACLEVVGGIENRSAPFRWGKARAGEGASVAISAPPRRKPNSTAKRKLSAPAEAAERRRTPESAPADGVLHLRGAPYQIGRDYGRSQRLPLRRLLRRYADLTGSAAATSIAGELAQLENLAAPDELEEMRGIAEGAGVSIESVVAHNLRIYPDLGGGCVQFAVTAESNAGGRLLHAANVDLPVGMLLGDATYGGLQVRSPVGGRSWLTFALAGQVGGIVGINDAHLAVTSCMLLDLPRREGTRRGRLHALLVKDVMESADGIDAALDILKGRSGTGAWGMCLSDAGGRICYVEYDGSTLNVRDRSARLVAANHTLLHRGVVECPPHSRNRLERLKQLLEDDAAGEEGSLDAPRACRILRDQYDARLGRAGACRTMHTVCRVDNQVGVVFDPQVDRAYVVRPAAEASTPTVVELDLAALFKPRSSDNSNNGERSAQAPGSSSSAIDVNKRRENGQPHTEVSPPQTRRSSSISLAEFTNAAMSVEGGPPLGDAGNICQRFVLRTVELPLPKLGTSGGKRRLGPAIIVGRNSVADGLHEWFQQQGIQATRISPEAAAEAASLVDAVWDSSPAPTLILATPWDDDAAGAMDAGRWSRRRDRGVLASYGVCQRWFQRAAEADLLGEATVVGVVRAGGDFGFSGEVGGVESGALTGLLKGLFVESSRAAKSGLRVKAIDLGGEASLSDMIERIEAELSVDTPEVEVGYCRGRRLVVRPVLQPLEAPARFVPTPESHWLVTGGGRGVTPIVARELARRYGLNLHLVGTTPLPAIDPGWLDLDDEGLRNLKTQVIRDARAESSEPPIRAWERLQRGLDIHRNLRAMRQCGIKVEYYHGDLAEPDALRRVLATVRERGGAIEGVLHGAGFERASRFDRKTNENVERTLRAKVDGAIWLQELSRHAEMKYFLAFGSISGRFGGTGQTDYCMANDLLAKLMLRLRSDHPEKHFALFHWHSWDEVGMAVRPESKHIKDLHGIRFMPTREGSEHLIRELTAGLPEGEVLITDWQYYKRFYPDEFVQSMQATAERTKQEAEASPPAAVEVRSPQPVREYVAPRHILRLHDAPLAGAERSLRTSPAATVVLGGGAVGEALVSRLRKDKCRVLHLGADSDKASVLEILEQFAAEEVPPRLIVATAWDVVSRAKRIAGEWSARRESQIMLPTAVCQKWLKLITAAGEQHGDLTAVLSLGGDFGLSGKAPVPESGALAGLLKSIHVEQQHHGESRIKIKVLDVPPGESPNALAAAVLEEIAAGDDEVEVALAGESRRVLRAHRVPLPASSANAIERGGTWVVSGGGRGITARVALELGRRFDLNLHLLGRTPRLADDSPWRNLSDDELRAGKKQIVSRAVREGRSPGREWETISRQVELDRNLEQFRRAGVSFTYHCVDVGDRGSLETTLAAVRRSHGPIAGVLHGSGVRNAASFLRMRTEDVEESLHAKLDAAVHLVELTAGDPLRYFIAFGSLGGRFGINGGGAYAAANEALAKIVGSLRTDRPGCRAVTFHWHSWGEAGLMTRGGSFGASALMKLSLMPVSEGIEHILAELSAAAGEGEVLTTDGSYHKRFYKKQLVVEDEPPLPNTPNTSNTSIASGTFPIVSVPRSQGRGAIAELNLDPVKDPFLQQHRLKGRPVLPLVIAMEALLEAWTLQATNSGSDDARTSLCDVRVVQPLRFFSDTPLTARVRSAAHDAAAHGNRFPLQLVADFRNRQGRLVQADRVHFEAVAEPARRTPRQLLANDNPPGMHKVEYPEDDLVLYHGPVFRLLTQIHVGPSDAWGTIDARAPGEMLQNRRPVGWLISPAVIDAALFACGIYMYVHRPGSVSVPEAISRIDVFQQPRAGEQVRVRLSARSILPDRAAFDFCLFGDDGRLLYEVEGYHSRIIPGTVQ